MMLNSNDIYSHLLNGGAIKDLYVALDKEITEANKKIKAAREAEQKEKELAEKIEKGKAHAVQVLKTYFSLVNPDVTEDAINFALDALATLKNVEIKVDSARGKSRRDYAACDGSIETVPLTDEEWKEIWNTLFPFNFMRK